jgi:hypothetical protein
MVTPAQFLEDRQTVSITRSRLAVDDAIPPMSTALRWWAMNPPPASSLTRVSLQRNK